MTKGDASGILLEPEGMISVGLVRLSVAKQDVGS